MDQYRAVFDFKITFTNGGDIGGEGFRLDVPDPDIDAEATGILLIRHLGLLMVKDVELTRFEVIAEPHRGGRGVEAEPVRRSIVDLGHPIRTGMITHPGLPGPEITDFLTREASATLYGPGTTFHIGRISMVANTGTYLDTPFHRFGDGADLAQIPVHRLVDLEGLVIHLVGSEERAVDIAQLAPFEVVGRAVLIHTGWDRHWSTPAYAEDAPYLTAAATEWLVDQGVALVGIDSVNIDDIEDEARPAHTALLGGGIPIVEHLTGLDRLPPTGFRFHAAAPAIEGLGTFPVRAYAVVG